MRTWPCVLALSSAIFGCAAGGTGTPPLCGVDGSCPQGLFCWPDQRCRAQPAPPDLAMVRTDSGALPPDLSVLAPPVDLAMADLVAGPDLAKGCGMPCADPTPLCDLASGLCVPCLPGNDTCRVGSYCEKSGNGYRCTQGCKNDPDCKAQNPNAMKPFCCNRVCADLASDRMNCGVCGQGCGNKSCCAGVCSEPMNDLQNCGGCGNVCGGGNAAWVCAGGACAITGCGQGFDDCNKDPKDGCEVDLRKDDLNCGACAKTCARPNGSGTCMSGQCMFQCNQGFADCNKDALDGCEVNLTNGVQNCGQCGKQCNPPPNGAAGCVDGVCGIGACLQGFDDCDKNVGNGCETPVGNDVKNCGACGNVCKPAPNGMVVCMNGVCLGACGGAFKDCNNNMADGCETNTDSDVNNCKECGVKCNLPNAVADCNGGCVVKSCNQGFGNCNNNSADGCEAPLGADKANCGQCGRICPMNQPVCQNGVCTNVDINGVFASYDSAGRKVYLWKTPPCLDLTAAGAANFCPNRGLKWWSPKSQPDAQMLITFAFNLDMFHTWINVYGVTTGKNTINGFNVITDSPDCVSYVNNVGFAAFRKWGCSFCNPIKNGSNPMYDGQACCWDGNSHMYDWFVCEG